VAPPAAAAPAHVTVQLQSVPSGAAILDERGNQIGTTPHDMLLPAGGARRLRFEKPGFRPVERQLSARSDATVSVQLDVEAPALAAPHGQHPPGGKGRGAAGLDSMAGTIDPFAR
jgi:hypothetical protein